jgi:hypothetical protein
MGKETFEETWDYFKKQNPELTIYELACLEKEWGDITFVHEGQRFWVECCFAMGKETFEETWDYFKKQNPELTIYELACLDEPGKMWFIPSKQWNAYVKKCDKVRQGKKSFRIVPKHLIGDELIDTSLSDTNVVTNQMFRDNTKGLFTLSHFITFLHVCIPLFRRNKPHLPGFVDLTPTVELVDATKLDTLHFTEPRCFLTHSETTFDPEALAFVHERYIPPLFF